MLLDILETPPVLDTYVLRNLPGMIHSIGEVRVEIVVFAGSDNAANVSLLETRFGGCGNQPSPPSPFSLHV
jgi:hypothetical protein